ncbi:MAG TPA: GGDEF domain-containing protein [Sphingomonadaceae bacterium]|jgi:diguanylate cyclase (GGDEF)-like protein|nr:GGDEF domain-containing protein [Sphingomonadaceae bacterium]
MSHVAARSWRLPLVAILLVVMLVGTEVVGFLSTSRYQRSLIALRNDTREMRILQQALVDQKESAEDYIASGDRRALRDFLGASATLSGQRRAALPLLDREAAGQPTLPSQEVAELSGLWSRGVSLADEGKAGDAQRFVQASDARVLITGLRIRINDHIDVRNAEGERLESRIKLGGTWVVILQVLGGLVTVLLLIFAFRSHAREAVRRRAAVHEAISARQEVEVLFDMADTLQSAAGFEDAHAVLSSTSGRLLPHLAGRLYVFNNSRDRLDLIAGWGHGDEARDEFVAPSACWALKRGKAHLNRAADSALRCEHFDGTCDTLEMPMMARGEVYGLLTFSSRHPDAAEQLTKAKKIISALTDGMSLALSNLSLREKLRNQALRDPLTGLYNRRYMEDMLDRFVRLAARNDSAFAVVMIDLDHFKRLNDQHGHLFGDNVLRAVAGALNEALRETDVACRYGGEELMVLLPDCDMDAAVRKAEEIRLRIEALSSAHGVEITASLGVAAMPATASNVADLAKAADVALYEAKAAGRNCVKPATQPARPTLVAAE